MSGNRVPNVSPLRPPGAGPGSRGACDFLGSPCPRGRSILGGFAGGFNDFIDEANGLDFDEFLRVIGLDDSSEDQEEFEFNEFLELIEHIDNQRW